MIPYNMSQLSRYVQNDSSSNFFLNAELLTTLLTVPKQSFIQNVTEPNDGNFT